MANAGFKIGDRVYEIPSRYRMGDFVLIEELTGMDADEFSERLDAVNDAVKNGDRGGDMLVLTALMGVAVWQGNPRWRRDKVVRFVEDFDTDDLVVEGGDEDDSPTKGALPPSPSDDTSAASTSTPEPLPVAVQV